LKVALNTTNQTKLLTIQVQTFDIDVTEGDFDGPYKFVKL